MPPEQTDTVAAISQLYERQLAAKDETIAALSRRVGAAEQARDLCREELAALAAGAAPAAPREDRLLAVAPAAAGRAGRVPVGAWHTATVVCRVEPGTAEQLLQRLRWRLLPRLRRRAGFLACQLLAVDPATALVVGLWAARSEAERAVRVAEALLAGPACAMVRSCATHVAALAPADEAAREQAATADGAAPLAARRIGQHSRTAD